MYKELRENKLLRFLIYLFAMVAIIPLAPLLCRFVPPILVGEFNVDLIVATVVAILIIRGLIWLLYPFMLPLYFLFFIALIYCQLTNKYQTKNLLSDYKTIIEQNWGVKEVKESDFLPSRLFEDGKSRTERLVRAKVDPTDSLVRNFSIQHSIDFFGEYQKKYGLLVRKLSLFKYINNNFNYVPDPKRDEYYATAHETILNGFGGDCDDHSILMASCMESIGAKCRLVIIKGHMYPELYVGNKDDFEIMQKAVIQLFNNQNIDQIYYHESNGEYWINLDYTAHYPGGRYMSGDVVMVISLD